MQKIILPNAKTVENKTLHLVGTAKILNVTSDAKLQWGSPMKQFRNSSVVHTTKKNRLISGCFILDTSTIS